MLLEAQAEDSRIDVMQDILEKATRWNASIQWVPSHINLEGNDVADLLAKHGTEETAINMTNKLFDKDASSCKNKSKVNLGSMEDVSTTERSVY